MDTIENLKKLLSKHNAEYELFYHNQPIRSVEDAKKYFAINQIAPTLIIKSDGSYYATIISGVKGRIDFSVLEKTLHCKKVKLADKIEVEKNTGFRTGSIPLVGLNLPYILDKSLLSQKFVCGGSGAEQYTLKISIEDLVKINQPILVEFN